MMTRQGMRQPIMPPVMMSDPFEPVPVSEADRTTIMQQILHKYADPLYRKPTRKELDAVAPDPELAAKYSQFLQRPNTGLVKLVPDAGCAENTKVVTVSEACLKFTMPGAGNSFSFRTRSYRTRDLADLTFSGQQMRVTGLMMHGIMVNLGDQPVETASLQMAGLKYLVEFQPSSKIEDANKVNSMLIDGVKKDGYLYSRSLAPAENNTYGLRAIAYRGRVRRAIKGVEYNELDFDKRRDVIVVFRVVEQEPDGSITILWNQLSDQESPKLKQPVKSEEKEGPK
jgi:hypothetical protein